jgi:ATP-dependent Clp protease ATP-binding subunit ClpC
MESELKAKTVGFAQSAGPSTARLESVATAAAKRRLPLELYNRIDEVLFFAPLSRAEVLSVAENLLGDLAATLENRGIRLDIAEGVTEALLQAGGWDPDLGARPVRRVIARLVEAPIAELLLRRDIQSGGVLLLDVEDGEIVVDAVDGGSDQDTSLAESG